MQTVGLCLGIIQAWDIPQSSPAQQGLSFTPTNHLIVIGQAYVVPIVLRLDDIYQRIRTASQYLQRINKLNNDMILTSSVSQNIVSFQGKFQGLHDNMQDFLLHIVKNNDDKSTSKRKPRGLINLVGSLANTLFGTATQAQVDFIHKRLSSLDTFTEEERKILNVHSEVINVTLRELTNVHHALEKLEKATHITKTLLRRMESHIEHDEKSIMSLEILLHIQFALTSIATDHINFKIGLQELMETKLSPNIITNAFLLKLLDEVSVKHELLFPPKI